MPSPKTTHKGLVKEGVAMEETKGGSQNAMLCGPKER